MVLIVTLGHSKGPQLPGLHQHPTGVGVVHQQLITRDQRGGGIAGQQAPVRVKVIVAPVMQPQPFCLGLAGMP
jgi:hypothetical protein